MSEYTLPVAIVPCPWCGAETQYHKPGCVLVELTSVAYLKGRKVGWADCKAAILAILDGEIELFEGDMYSVSGVGQDRMRAMLAEAQELYKTVDAQAVP